MADYEKIEYEDNCSDITTSIRDTQFAEGVNTIFDCRIQTLNLYQDNVAELVLQFRLQSCPDQLVDKYTFHSQQIHVIKDTKGVLFLDPWNDATVDLFADIYVDGHKKFTDNFKNKLGDLADDFDKNKPVVNDDNIKRIAWEVLQIYVANNS